MDSIPYSFRLTALLAFAIVMMVWDRARNGADAKRWKEYGVLMIAGVVGALYGMLNDFVTSTVSPDYFIVGKGLAAGSGVRFDAMALGAKAGCSAAAVVCGVWLVWCNRLRGDHRMIMRAILRAFWIPIACAGLLSVLFPVLAGWWDPLGFGSKLKGLISETKISALRHVWWAHLGAYAGLLLGCGIGMVRLKRVNR